MNKVKDVYAAFTQSHVHGKVKADVGSRSADTSTVHEENISGDWCDVSSTEQKFCPKYKCWVL